MRLKYQNLGKNLLMRLESVLNNWVMGMILSLPENFESSSLLKIEQLKVAQIKENR